MLSNQINFRHPCCCCQVREGAYGMLNPSYKFSAASVFRSHISMGVRVVVFLEQLKTCKVVFGNTIGAVKRDVWVYSKQVYSKR